MLDFQQLIGRYNALEKVAVKYFFSVLSMNPKKRKEYTDDLLERDEDIYLKLNVCRFLRVRHSGIYHLFLA